MKWSFYLIKHLKYFFKLHFPRNSQCDDRDPPWINSNMKQLIQDKNDTYRIYILNDKNPQIFKNLKYLQIQLNKLI